MHYVLILGVAAVAMAGIAVAWKAIMDRPYEDCRETPIPLRMRQSGVLNPPEDHVIWTCSGCGSTFVGPGVACPRGCEPREPEEPECFAEVIPFWRGDDEESQAGKGGAR